MKNLYEDKVKRAGDRIAAFVKQCYYEKRSNFYDNIKYLYSQSSSSSSSLASTIVDKHREMFDDFSFAVIIHYDYDDGRY